MKKTFLSKAKTMIAIAGFCAVALVAQAWTAPDPSVPAPGGNVPAPVNTGSVTQYKTGNLGVQSLFASGASGNGVFVQNFASGVTCLTINLSCLLGSGMFSAMYYSSTSATGLKINSSGGVYMYDGSGVSTNGPDSFLAIASTGLIKRASPSWVTDQILNVLNQYVKTQYNIGLKNNEIAVYKDHGINGSPDAGWKAASTRKIYNKNRACIYGFVATAAQAQSTPYWTANGGFYGGGTAGGAGDLTLDPTCYSQPCRIMPDDSVRYWSCGSQFETNTICGDGASGHPTISTPQICNNVEIGKIINCSTQSTTPTSPDQNYIDCN